MRNRRDFELNSAADVNGFSIINLRPMELTEINDIDKLMRTLAGDEDSYNLTEEVYNIYSRRSTSMSKQDRQGEIQQAQIQGIIPDFSEMKVSMMESLEEIKEIECSDNESFESESFDGFKTTVVSQQLNDQT